jgi:hypothetical protein
VTGLRDHWWWRPGWRTGRRFFTFHVTFADQPEVQALVASARARLAGLPGLDLVPAQWLHLTMQGIGFSDEVAVDDLAKIIAAAREYLSVVPPVTVMIGPVAVADEGAACWAGPAGVTVRAVDLIRLGRDRHVYEWEPVERFQLGPRRGPAPRGPG